MTYTVRLSRRAILDLKDIYAEKSALTSPPAAAWFLRLRETVFSLETLPYRGSIAKDKRSLRQLLYGNKPHIYRILYTIDDTNATVDIAQIVHGARKPLTP